MSTEPRLVNTYTEEKAEELLRREQPFPHFANAFLGAPNVKALKELLQDQDLVELDTLNITGELTEQEFIEYVMLLPQYDELRNRFLNLAKQIGEELKTKVRPALDRNFNERGGLIQKTDVGIIRLITAITTIINSQFTKGVTSHRNVRLQEMRNYIFEQVSLQIFIEAGRYPERVSAFGDLIKFINLIYREWSGGSDFPGTILAGFIKNAKDGMKANTDSLTSIENSSNNPEDPDPVDQKALEEKLERETSELLRKIKEEATFRKITMAEKSTGHGAVQIYGDEYEGAEGQRPTLLCYSRVRLDPTKGYRELEVSKTTHGQATRHHYFNQGSFEVDIDRSSGELKFVTTNTPISLLYARRTDYLKLKRTIFKFILEYLESKDEDISEQLVGLSERDIARIEEIRARIAGEEELVILEEIEREEAENEALIKEAEEAVERRIKEAKRRTIERETKDAEIAANPDGAEVELTPQTCTKFLRGLRGGRVRQAMINLLGQPISIAGSHHKFQCRNGGTYPLPIHDSEEVGVGTLITCLKKYGVSVQEFYEAL